MLYHDIYLKQIQIFLTKIGCLTKELCPGLVSVQSLDLLRVLHCHVQPLLWALFAVELRGDALLHLSAKHRVVRCYPKAVRRSFCLMLETKPLTWWASRCCPWHGAAGLPVGQAAADAGRWPSPEGPHSARPSGSLARSRKEASQNYRCEMDIKDEEWEISALTCSLLPAKKLN